MEWEKRRKLGNTELEVSRIGFGGSFGAPTEAYLDGFDAGINVFYWGSLRREKMGRAIRQLAAGHRDQLVVVIQSYSRLGLLLKPSLRGALRRLKLQRADILLLGWHNQPPSGWAMDAALSAKQRGLARYLAVSCHNRPTFQKYIDDGIFDVIMVRYNAAHRGAEEEVFPYLPEKGGPGVFAYTATRWGHLPDPKRTPLDLGPLRGADCYRFVLSRPEVDLVFCGPSQTRHVHEAILALDRGPLSATELERAREIGDYVYRRKGAFFE